MNKTKKPLEKWQKKELVLKYSIHSGLILWAIAVLFPFYWMLVSSIKSQAEYNEEVVPKLFPSSPTFSNYAYAFTEVPLGRYFINTVIFTIATTALMMILTVLAAYAFSHMRFKGKNTLFTAFLSLMMIPNELMIITNYVTVTNMDLRNSFTGLILPSAVSVFYIYLLKQNFSQVPTQIYYAAKVDGTSDIKFLFKVLLPMCKPTVITVAVLKMIECWNSYVWPRLVTDEEAYYLVSEGIQTIRESGFGRANVPAMMAAVVIISLPLIVLFLVFRDKIMEGVVRGGIKG